MRLPDARRRASSMCVSVVERLADLLREVEQAPDTDLEADVQSQDRAALEEMVYCVQKMLAEGHAGEPGTLARHDRLLVIIKAHSDYLFHALAGQELRSDWQKLVEKYGPRGVIALAKAAVDPGIGVA